MPDQYIHGAEIIEIDTGPRPITTPSSAIVGLVGSAPVGPVNVPTLIHGTLKEGVDTFGPVGYGFSIPDAIKAITDQSACPIVVINVADPTNNSLITAVTATPYTFGANGQVSLGHLAVTNVALTGPVTALAYFQGDTLPLPAGATSPVVKSSDGSVTYAVTTDYTFSGSTITRVTGGGGHIVANQQVLVTYTITGIASPADYTIDAENGILTLVVGGKLLTLSTVNVAFSYLDPTKVTASMINGGVDDITGQYTGIYALLGSASTVGVTPRILCAPGFTGAKTGTTANPVVAQLLTIAARLRSIVVAEGPDTTDSAAISFRNDWGDARLYFVDPGVKWLNPATNTVESKPASAYVAGVFAMVDNAEGFYVSPSNHIINGIVGTTRPIEFAMGDPSARSNILNSNQINTVINIDGYRLWGNRTTSADPVWTFINVRRTADMIEDAILNSMLWAIDRNITKLFVQSVVDSVNAYLAFLKAEGAIVDGNAWADPDLNTAATIAAGQLFIDFDFAAYTPAERITFRAQINNNYLTEVLLQQS